jgi:hypothetical protein
MQSPYFTHEDYDTALEMHVAENKRHQKGGTRYQAQLLKRRLPMWKRTIMKWLGV